LEHYKNNRCRQMKLFLVISDSHGDMGCLKRIISQYPSIGSVIHLGDYYRDAVRLQNLYPDKEYYMVPGNCDFSVYGIPSEMVLKVEGLRVLITHGHGYGVKSGPGRIISRGLHDKMDVVLFGHTHMPMVHKSGGLLLVNPGSAGHPRSSFTSTYALLEIGNGMAEARIMEVL